MAGIYVYSEKAQLAAELVGFAKSLGKQATVLTFDAAGAEAVKNCGADKVYLVQGGAAPEAYAKSVAELLTKEEAELLLVGASVVGRDFAARVSGYMDSAMISDVSSIAYVDGAYVTERTMYGGAVIEADKIAGQGVVTIGGGKFAPVSGEAAVEAIELAADTRVQLVETAPIVKGGADLSKAEKVVCIGMGMVAQEDMKMAEDLAAVLGAELGCTRGIADERFWLPVEQYIGISGAIIKPNLYLSMGVSGQVQHIFGVRDSKLIVAIDKNDTANIFNCADYGIVGDMYEIVPLLIEELKK